MVAGDRVYDKHKEGSILSITRALTNPRFTRPSLVNLNSLAVR